MSCQVAIHRKLNNLQSQHTRVHFVRSGWYLHGPCGYLVHGPYGYVHGPCGNQLTAVVSLEMIH